MTKMFTNNPRRSDARYAAKFGAGAVDAVDDSILRHPFDSRDFFCSSMIEHMPECGDFDRCQARYAVAHGRIIQHSMIFAPFSRVSAGPSHHAFSSAHCNGC